MIPLFTSLRSLLAGLAGLALATSLSGQQLTWRPPTLINPITVYPTNTNKNLTLTAGQDYIVQMPATPITVRGGISISGGHNVVLIGGEIRHDTDYLGDWGKDQRGLYLRNWSGTFHLEGVLIRGTKLGEGIDIDTRTEGAVMQVQNVRVDWVQGSYSGNHADVIQNWGGPTYYRIDRLTGYTNYQGFMIQPTQFGYQTILADFRNMNLSGIDNKGCYMIFRAGTEDFLLTNVWHNPLGSCSAPKGAYPHSDPEWAVINMGLPPGGDFVPASLVGVAYTSPGYLPSNQVEAPTFTPRATTFASPQPVTIATATTGATIRYTLDGSTPTATTGTIYTGPITFPGATIVKAIAYKSGMTDSLVATSKYVLSTVVATAPTTGGASQYISNFTNPQTEAFYITYTATPSAVMDGTVAMSFGAPTAFSGFATLVRFNNSGYIDARNGGSYAAASPILYAAGQTYAFRVVIDLPAHTYSIYVTPPGGTELTVGSNFAFRTEQASVTTLNNWSAIATNPTGGSTLTVSNFVLKSAAVAAPVFTPPGGTYSTAQSVSITTGTAGATIRYTLDGTTPTSSVGTVYTGPISIPATSTLKAIAYKSGWDDSPVTTANYTITTLINETFSTSPASNFTVVSGGTWAVTSGKYALTSPASGSSTVPNGNISTHVTTLTGDWTLSVEGSVTGTTSAWNDFSVLFGYQNSTNYYYVSLNESNDAGTSGIFKIAGTTKTQLADITSLITAGTTYAVKVVKSGTTYQVYLNSTLVATATDATWTSGKVGFGTNNDSATYDNLLVTSP